MASFSFSPLDVHPFSPKRAKIFRTSTHGYCILLDGTFRAGFTSLQHATNVLHAHLYPHTLLHRDLAPPTLLHRDLEPFSSAVHARDSFTRPSSSATHVPGSAVIKVASSSRPKRVIRRRDLGLESERYLPRLACHNSLPPGRIACAKHEWIRRAGLVGFVDEGPRASD